MITLCIDTRMIKNSGIGRYIQEIIPLLLKEGGFNITCLGDFEALSKHNWFSEVNFVEMRSRIFTISEQFELSRKIPNCDIFWSPQYNVPIFPIKAKKRVVTIHDVYQMAHFHELTLLKKVFVKMLTFFAVKFSHSIVTVSNFSKSEILRCTSANIDKISVIYNGLNDYFSKDIEFKSINEKFILFVGNIKPHKNLHNALQSFRIFIKKNDSYKFYIVGKKDGFISGVGNIEKLIKGIEEKVIFTGYISDLELKIYYSNASIFFFPSKYEGFGLPILEAMSFSKPIVSSSSASMPEVGGDSILYCNPNDINDMAEKLQNVLDNKFEFSTMKYSQQLKKFSWVSAAKKYKILFTNLSTNVNEKYNSDN
jgi:glycosyltransferase involved in cell wall biosynthesis